MTSTRKYARVKTILSAAVIALSLGASEKALAACSIDAQLRVSNNLTIFNKQVKELKHVLIIHRVGASGSIRHYETSNLAYGKDKAVTLGVLHSAAEGAAPDWWTVVAVWDDHFTKKPIVHTLNPGNLNGLAVALNKSIESATTAELKALATATGIVTTGPVGVLIDPGIKLISALIIGNPNAPSLAGYGKENLCCGDHHKEIRIAIGGDASDASRTVWLLRPESKDEDHLGLMEPNTLLDPEKIAQTLLARLVAAEKKDKARESEQTGPNQ